MRCQYCYEQEAVKNVNYMNEEEPQYAWMCEECASCYTNEEEKFVTNVQE